MGGVVECLWGINDLGDRVREGVIGSEMGLAMCCGEKLHDHWSERS